MPTSLDSCPLFPTTVYRWDNFLVPAPRMEKQQSGQYLPVLLAASYASIAAVTIRENPDARKPPFGHMLITRNIAFKERKSTYACGVWIAQQDANLCS